MRTPLFVIIFLVLFQSINGQPPIAWQKLLGGSQDDRAYCIEITNDNGYIIAATTESNDGDLGNGNGAIDIWIIKLKSDGEISWQKRFGGSDVETVSAIKQTSEGGYILIGNTFSTDGIALGNHGGSDVLIMKLSSLGSAQWQKLLGGINNDYGHDIVQASDGSYVAVGGSCCHFGENGYFQGEEYWAAKLNFNGLVEWEKTFGGNLGDRAFSIVQKQDGNFLVAGNSDSSFGEVTNNFGSDDCWVFEMSNQGNLVREKTFGGSGIEYLADILIDGSEGYYLLTSTKSSDGDITGLHGHFDVWLAKISNENEILWKKCLGGSDADFGSSIAKASDGDILISAWSYSKDGDLTENAGNADAWLAKITTDGDLAWQKTFGGNEFDGFNSAQEVENGTIVAVGRSSSSGGDIPNGHGKEDVWVVKFSDASIVKPNSISGDIKQIYLFPNPASDLVGIELPSGVKAYKVIIGDLLGQRNYEIGINANSTFDVSNLSEGLYLIQMQDVNGNIYYSNLTKINRK